jgi:hydrogenase maturation protein HypF
MRVRIIARGTIQGVGFRPFVFRTAHALSLTGWVRNEQGSVVLEVQGDAKSIDAFRHALEHTLPPPGAIESLDVTTRGEIDESGFVISESRVDACENGSITSALPPDLAPCRECLAEVHSPFSRRYGYPFTSCASCGPRYSIATSLPYDRARTSMRAFPTCEACAEEYENPHDRRHHAQTIACPSCGPTLTLLTPQGLLRARAREALADSIAIFRIGGVLAIRGVGGFQLVCDATSSKAIARIRAGKHRPHQALAVMVKDIDAACTLAPLNDEQRAALTSLAAPIVLVEPYAPTSLDEGVAPGSPWLGLMLPSTPLHSFLTESVKAPLVCTSGNRSGEPLARADHEAISNLGPFVDAILTHDLQLQRPLDDSVMTVRRGRTRVFRRARGISARTIGRVPQHVTLLALGAHQKNTVTLAHGGVLFPSPHVGDLTSLASRERLEQTARDLCNLLGTTPRLIACDLHPNYASTELAEALAREWSLPLCRVQHHHAHVAAVLAEHDIAPSDSVLGLAWDGTGFGLDGSIWGAEALLVQGAECSQFATMRAFPLPGGERAGRDPRISAFGLLAAFSPENLEAFARPWFGDDLEPMRAVLNRSYTPKASSLGRFFDAMSALVCGHGPSTFEGQAAILLERIARNEQGDGIYPVELKARDDGVWEADLSEFVRRVLRERHAGVRPELIARRIHDSLVALGVTIAERAGCPRVALSGGCFQNSLLSEGLEEALSRRGFHVLTAEQVPPNDGGISVGQAWIAAHGPKAPHPQAMLDPQE